MTLGFCNTLVLGAALVVTSAGGLAGEAYDPITISHGYSYFGDLKYPANFAHLDFVNPEAPKGGEISQWSFGTFDSFNSYARKGNQAALSSIPFESVSYTHLTLPTICSV